METDSLTTVEQKPPKLRWYQWRLRSMFLLILLAAIGMSWLTVTMRDGRRQNTAEWEIRLQGGSVVSEPTWLGRLLRDYSQVKVTRVDLSRNSDEPFPGKLPIDAVLGHLERLHQLQELDLSYSKVSDAGLVHLESLSQLEWLLLAHTRVADAELTHLEGLRQLQWLNLSGTKVSDAGLVHLENLSQLRWLNLSATKVSDAGLAHLKGLRQLQTLNLLGTKVTDQGEKRLQQALPGCEVYH
jgi:Leucine-rich repeat (LRR) protein